MSNRDSLWYDEVDVKSGEIHDMPPHHSDRYIDIDFFRRLLFINFKDQQTGIEILAMDDKDIPHCINGLINLFNLKYKAEDILRFCFDFDNNLIKVKDANSNEDNIYFMDLESFSSQIIEALNFEQFSAEELSDDVDALLFLKALGEMPIEEQLDFARTVMKMEEYIKVLEEENELLKRINNLQINEND